jgi:hypothetical protein
MSQDVNNFKTRDYSLTLSLDTNAYTSGDVLAAPQEVSLADANAPGGFIKGRVTSITVLDKDDQGLALDVVVMKSEVTLGTENAAVSISDTDAEAIAGIVSVTSYIDLINSRFASALMDPVEFTVTDKSLWIGAIARGAPTHTASGIVLTLSVQFDNLGV